MSLPRRYIYNDTDMDHFLASPAKGELLRATTAMGRACSDCSGSSYRYYRYRPEEPLVGLSPATAALRGALEGMGTWIKDIPPVDARRARFGNPAFKSWHGRLTERSCNILRTVFQVHKEEHANSSSTIGNKGDGDDDEYDLVVLQRAAERGKEAAAASVAPASPQPGHDDDDRDNDGDELVIRECAAYLQAAFGHPIRLDYGTGHESSFQVLLFALLKLGCFVGSQRDATSRQPPPPPPPPTARRLKAVTLSLYHAYLSVTRPLQTDYVLEPAGSHGVWGLDDYHCLPFYFGACQLQSIAATAATAAQAQSSSTQTTTRRAPDDYNDDDDEEDLASPSCIHRQSVLDRYGDAYLYLGCIRFIKTIKRGVPFFESSPMLNDISRLTDWQKVSNGLLRLYDGEVLKKRQVVQHFVFGRVFSANWTPSEIHPPRAPERTFVAQPHGGGGSSTTAAVTGGGPPVIMTRAPWAHGAQQGNNNNNNLPLPPPTRAPWAK